MSAPCTLLAMEQPKTTRDVIANVIDAQITELDLNISSAARAIKMDPKTLRKALENKGELQSRTLDRIEVKLKLPPYLFRDIKEGDIAKVRNAEGLAERVRLAAVEGMEAIAKPHLRRASDKTAKKAAPRKIG